MTQDCPTATSDIRISPATCETSTLPLPVCGDEPHLTTCPIGAFIFDVDGVLADTATLHTEAWRRLAKEEGLDFDEAAANALRGLSREDSLRRLLHGREVPADRFTELLDRKNGYYLGELKHLSERVVLPGVRLLLAGLRDLGIKLAAASLSRNARAVLLRTGLVSNFDVIVDGNDLEESRSDLNRFHLIARALRVDPARCVVVEDSTAGIAAARAAGMRSVGVGDYERLCAATMVLDSLRGTDAGTLVYWLGHRNHP
ncbi:MAG TPA: beta-phosphoglucomutase family hydrolase [Phycisphaerae bacterium]|nr:beta-phosphoglucomutase family hydrolase [Phycisphaerae bacterium]